LSRLPAGIAGLGTLAAPVVGVLAARMQLGEEPTFVEAIGMSMIIGALVLNTVQALTPRRDTQERLRVREAGD
jgi:drug/metabolite transporter (DMT)-like permease